MLFIVIFWLNLAFELGYDSVGYCFHCDDRDWFRRRCCERSTAAVTAGEDNDLLARVRWFWSGMANVRYLGGLG